MATKLAMTVAVKAIESQRCICRTHIFQLMDLPPNTSRCAMRRTSLRLRQKLFQLCKELLPSGVGAAIGLPLIRPEARLLHVQMRPRTRWRERKGHHASQIVGRIVVRKVPGVGQRLVRLDGKDLAVQRAAPVSAKIEGMADDGLEIVLHEPLLDQVRLRERA